MAIAKVNGEKFTATITFSHRGVGGTFDVGVGVKYTPTPTWALARVTVKSDEDWYEYTVVVSGTFNTDLGDGRTVDVLKFIQSAGGPKDIGGQGFLLADWDRDVYVVVKKVEFSNLLATYS